MRKETIVKEIYKFDELSKESQEKALDYFRETNDFPFLFDDLSEQLKEIIPDSDLKLQGSLSYCQGDGVAFYGDLDSKQMKELLYKNSMGNEVYEELLESIEITLNIEKSMTLHLYDHYNTMIIELDRDFFLADHLETLLNELEEDMSQILRDISKDLEKSGYDNITYQNSEECIKENIEANDYEFTDDGEMY